MGALLCGLATLLAFFVPIVCPLLAALTAGLAARPIRRGRGRLPAVGGCLLALVGALLHLWVWRFGHLP